MVTGFAVVTIGVKVLSKPIVAPFDPFSAYVDIFPGQHMSAVRARGFLCNSTYDYYHDPAVEDCTFTPAAGVISGVNVAVSEDVIRQITFTMRENSLKVGDLVLLMAVQHFHAYTHDVFFFFGKKFVRVSTSAVGSPSMIRPVWSVSFTDTDQLQ
jgi:hypothetical protein